MPFSAPYQRPAGPSKGSRFSTYRLVQILGATSLTGSLTFASTITGGSGVDTIVGGNVVDTIVGGAGNDSITGGLLGDTLTGGSGVDTFFMVGGGTAALWTSSLAVTGSMDSITDFVTGTDKISIINTGVATSSVVMTSVTVATAADITALLAGIGNSVAATVGGAEQVGLITVSGGAMAGTYLLLNDLVNAASALDSLIKITGVSGTVTASDFAVG